MSRAKTRESARCSKRVGKTLGCGNTDWPKEPCVSWDGDVVFVRCSLLKPIDGIDGVALGA